MAHDRELQKRTYPLPVYNFRVTVAGRSLSFAEVTGLARRYESAVYRHGLSSFEGERIRSFNFDAFTDLTLRKGSALGESSLFLHEWLRSREMRTLEISLCDEKGEPVLSWRVAKALPVTLEAPAFDAGSTAVAIETLLLKIRGVSVIKH